MYPIICLTRSPAGLRKWGKNWNKISKDITSKTAAQVKHYFHNHRKRLNLDDCLKNPMLIVSYHICSVEDDIRSSFTVIT